MSWWPLLQIRLGQQTLQFKDMQRKDVSESYSLLKFVPLVSDVTSQWLNMNWLFGSTVQLQLAHMYQLLPQLGY